VTEQIEATLNRAIGAASLLLIVIAGSNEAGKRTLFEVCPRPPGSPFVNADEIALALGQESAPLDPYAAARMADAVRRDLLARRASFCMETVFSDPAGQKLQFLRDAQQTGYRVLLIAIRIDSLELSIARVMQRVEAGGHDVPDEKLAARFPSTHNNLAAAIRFVDLALDIDNSEVERPFRPVATWVAGRQI
jgi:predicted ABC-type ATPase